MRPVRDEDGTRLVLLETSGESARVRDPRTGETSEVSRSRLDPVDDESPLETISRAVPGPRRRLLETVHDERALGLLLDLAQRGPLPARTMLSSYDLCESDLHGLLAEFRAAGLVEATSVGGLDGYDVTAETASALATLRAGSGSRD